MNQVYFKQYNATEPFFAWTVSSSSSIGENDIYVLIYKYVFGFFFSMGKKKSG